LVGRLALQPLHELDAHAIALDDAHRIDQTRERLRARPGAHHQPFAPGTGFGQRREAVRRPARPPAAGRPRAIDGRPRRRDQGRLRLVDAFRPHRRLRPRSRTHVAARSVAPPPRATATAAPPTPATGTRPRPATIVTTRPSDWTLSSRSSRRAATSAMYATSFTTPNPAASATTTKVG